MTWVLTRVLSIEKSIGKNTTERKLLISLAEITAVIRGQKQTDYTEPTKKTKKPRTKSKTIKMDGSKYVAVMR